MHKVKRRCKKGSKSWKNTAQGGGNLPGHGPQVQGNQNGNGGKEAIDLRDCTNEESAKISGAL